MKKALILKYILGITLALVIAASCLVSCNQAEGETTGNGTSDGTAAVTEEFDYLNADMTQYMSLDPSVFTNLSVTVSDIYEITDANVQKYIDGMLKKYPQPVKITDRPVVKGDTVYIYYQGLLDGVAFKGGTYAESDGAPYALKIGSGSFIDGFEDGLVGVVPSETSKDKPVALNLTFPEKYHSADLAGKSVVFNVYIEYISNETYVPEYNEDTVKNVFGFKGEGNDVISEFEDYIKELLKEEQDGAVLTEISKILLENVTVKSYPQQSVDYWYGQYTAQIQQNVDYYTAYGYPITFEQMALQMLGLKEGDDWKAELTEFAQNTVKSKMVYYYIAQHSNLSVSDEEYNKAIDDLIQYALDNGYKFTKEDILKEYGESYIRENTLFEEVNDLLFSNSTVSFKKSDSE